MIKMKEIVEGIAMNSSGNQEYGFVIPIVFGAKNDIASLNIYRELEEKFVFTDGSRFAILYRKTMRATQLFGNNLCRIFLLFFHQNEGI